VITLNGSPKRYKNLEAKTIAPRRGSEQEREHREKVDRVDWEAWADADPIADKRGLFSSFVDGD
jgi:hypothetical protein